jgi:hypothetical protein
LYRNIPEKKQTFDWCTVSVVSAYSDFFGYYWCTVQIIAVVTLKAVLYTVED